MTEERMVLYKVLLVEDEPIIREGIKQLLDWTSLDCIVVGEATNGIEGQNKIIKEEPDIVLLDINMPMKNGIDLLAECWHNHIFSTIIISGYDEFEYAKRAIQYGVTEYLLKPIDKKELENAVEQAKVNVETKREFNLMKSSIKTPGQVEVLNIDEWKEFNHKNKYVDEVIQYIQHHYHEKISMTDVSNELEMSVTYLNQKFKKGTSYTFNEYLNRYRIEKAIELIKKNEDKITIIATDVGFSNYRYFINVFKKYTDFLPSDFLLYHETGAKQD